MAFLVRTVTPILLGVAIALPIQSQNLKACQSQMEVCLFSDSHAGISKS